MNTNARKFCVVVHLGGGEIRRATSWFAKDRARETRDVLVKRYPNPRFEVKSYKVAQHLTREVGFT